MLRVAFACSLFLILSCSSKPLVHEIELRQDSFVSVGSDAPIFKRKGDTVESVATDPVLIESPNYVAVLIPPVVEPTSKVKVTLRPVDHWGDDLLQYKTEIMLNELFLGLGEVQKHFGEKKFDSALAKSTEMQSKFPRVGYLKFLKARCLMLTGNYDQAKKLLEVAVAQFPENLEGKELYEEALKASSNKRMPADAEGSKK